MAVAFKYAGLLGNLRRQRERTKIDYDGAIENAKTARSEAVACEDGAQRCLVTMRGFDIVIARLEEELEAV